MEQVHLCPFNQRGLLLALGLFILCPQKRLSSTMFQADTNKKHNDTSQKRAIEIKDETSRRTDRRPSSCTTLRDNCSCAMCAASTSCPHRSKTLANISRGSGFPPQIVGASRVRAVEALIFLPCARFVAVCSLCISAATFNSRAEMLRRLSSPSVRAMTPDGSDSWRRKSQWAAAFGSGFACGASASGATGAGGGYSSTPALSRSAGVVRTSGRVRGC